MTEIPNNLVDKYIIGADNLNAWSSNFDKSGYLKVLPQHKTPVIFKDPFSDWQKGLQTNTYYSSWGHGSDTLDITLTMSDLSQITIDGFGTLKSGDGKVPWLNNAETPYEFLRAYNGLIPGPFIITEPGDTIKIKLINDLSKEVQGKEQVSNLHTHGLHVSPVGHGDNVLLAIEPEDSWDYSITIPDNHAIGTNWYHPHLHGLTNEQVASGLAGQLLVLPPETLPDLNLWNPKEQSMHFMALNTFGIQQINRPGSATDPLNQSNAPLPAGTPLAVELDANGNPIYTLSDAVFTGYNALPAVYSPANPLGNPPPNLTFPYGGGVLAEPVENVIHTVNGQYNPTLELTTGEWNVFGFTNMNTNAFHNIQLVKLEADGSLTPQAVRLIGTDGDLTGAVASNTEVVTEIPILGPGQRYTIQNWFEKAGTYYFLSNGTKEILGDKAPTAIGNQKGFNDGHLIWGPQVLATVTVTGDTVTTGAAPEAYQRLKDKAQQLDQLIAEAQQGKFRERTYVWSTNIAAALAAPPFVPLSDLDPKSFQGAFLIDGQYFSENFTDSMVPLTMPMLGTKEIWNIRNTSTEWHPFHIHQNEFSILKVNGIPVNEISGYLDGVQNDTINLPPAYDPSTPPNTNNRPYGSPPTDPAVTGTPSEVSILMPFDDYPGTFVNHCHILFHEDAGMMAPVRVILNTADTWVGLAATEENRGELTLIRANNLKQDIALAAYGNNFRKGIDVAIADVNYKTKNNQNVTDNVTDVVTIQRSLDNSGGQFIVKVFDGKALIDRQNAGQKKLDGSDATLLLKEFKPFEDNSVSLETQQQQTASIAVGDINADGFADIVVGVGGTIAPKVKIFSGKDYTLLANLDPFHHGYQGKINLATGDINGDNFDDILVGQGSGGGIEIYSGKSIAAMGTSAIANGKDTAHDTALLSDYKPYGDAYTGEIDVTSGYILQRPKLPNSKAVQSYRANITTLAKDVPNGEQQKVKVLTYVGGGGHHGGSEQSTGDPLRLDAELAFDDKDKINDFLGSFADLTSASGEPVLYTRKQEGDYELVHLKDENIPEYLNFPKLFKDSNNDVFTFKNYSGKTKLKVTLTEEISSVVSEVGVCITDNEQGDINGIAPGGSGYTQAALKRSQVVFSSIFNSPNGFNPQNLIRLLEFNSNVNLKFFLVKNGSIDSVQAGLTSTQEVLFSDSLKITDLTSNEFSLSWKDNSGNNANTSQSLIVKVQVTNTDISLGSKLQGNAQSEIVDLSGLTGKVNAEFQVNSEAAYRNFVGFYQIVSADGGIDTNGDGQADLRPNDAGYAQEAVRRRVEGIDLSVGNQVTANQRGTFQAGSLFAPFIIANSSPEAVLARNNSSQVYFAFLGANSDRMDHIRLLGDNVFGFEDLYNNGDADFNDMIVQIKLSVA
ncbi:multicopper oxidase type 2 [Calothrix brevissima NIES-22]|nr:multicopper oxidase type 2 [Calothrix brevissima NIES-22]